MDEKAVPRPIRKQSFDDGRDSWTFVDAAPTPSLSGLVHAYGWWVERTTSFNTRRELAGTAGTLIVNLGSDLEIVDVAGSVWRLPAGRAFIAGLSQGTLLSRSHGPMEGVHLRAPLTTLARIAGTSVADLTDTVVPLDDLRAIRSLALAERLQEAGDQEARWRILDDVLTARMAEGDALQPSIDRLIVDLAAGVHVEALARNLGWSRKRLARTFCDAVGLHPRTFASLARFERFAAALQADPGLSLAQSAIDAGYSDQAHLTREVRRFADVTPAKLRQRLLPAGGGVRD